MFPVTIITPVAPYHEAAVERAAASIRNQTVPCQSVVIYDTDRRGAGWARNRGLEQVDTPFVAFLDADDWIEPTWAEDTLRAYDGRHYVYTDHWQENERIVEMSETAWDGKGAWHVITALLPTAAVKRIGGFDETLTGYEDTDFYWKLTRSGVWGRRLAKPLFHYGKDGKRAQTFRDRADRDKIVRSILRRYEGLPMAEECGGCGANPNLPSLPLNQMQDGDVLATTLWQGNRMQRGAITGRMYRGGWGKPLWVAPVDIDAAPHLFSRKMDMPPALSEEDIQAFKSFARDMFGEGVEPVRAPYETPVLATEVKPNVRRVLELYGKSAQPGAYIDTENWS